MEHPPYFVARSGNLAVKFVLPTNCPIERACCARLGRKLGGNWSENRAAWVPGFSLSAATAAAQFVVLSFTERGKGGQRPVSIQVWPNDLRARCWQTGGKIMVQFAVNPNRHDPYKQFKFRVTWDGRVVAGVAKVSALRRTTEVIEHREGGDPSTSRKSPGRTQFQPVVLARGLTHDTGPTRYGSLVKKPRWRIFERTS
jgi:T4-like virus tail tube protein gp19